MAKGNTSAFWLFFIISFNTLFTLSNVSATDQPPKNVLLLTSYHQGDRWNDSVIQGVREALESHEYVRLSIEDFDMRRYTGPDHTRVITEYIRAKYQSRPQDLILVSDDPALNLLLNVREDIFPNTPVVFCGINDFTQNRIQGQINITGVNEALSLGDTLELALKLFPKTTRIMAVVSDTDLNGRTNLEQYRAVAYRMKDRVQFGELLNMTEKEAPAILSRLPKDCLILRLISILKPDGGYLSIEDSIRMIANNAPVPVFTPWSFDLGDGALGGYVSSGLGQGRVAGNLAIRILDGQRADQIPVAMESPNVPMFDYKVLERFGINQSDLPKGSVVLNRQMSMLEQYWSWLLGIALFCGFQTVLIMASLTRGKRLHTANAALRESEERFAQLARQSRTVTWEVDSEGRYTFVSHIVKDVLGYDPEELVGKMHFYDLHPDENREAFKAAAFKVFDRKEQFKDLINAVRCKTGETLWVSTNGIPLLDIDGKLSGYRGSDTEISERKQAEEALSAERNRLAGVIEGTRTGTWEWNVQTGDTVFNARWAEIIGYTLEELSPVSIETWMKLAHPDDLKKSDELLEALFRGEVDYYEFESRMRHKNGEWVWVLDRGKVVSWTDGGKPLIMTGTHQNITERKVAEEAIKLSEAGLRTITNSAQDAIIRIDSHGIITFWNPAAEKILGYSLNEALGQNLHGLLMPERFESAYSAAFPEFVKSGSGAAVGKTIELVARRKDGKEIAVALALSAMVVQGKWHAVGVLRDITEQKQAEQALQESEERFRTLASESPISIVSFDKDGQVTFVSDWHLKKFTKGQLVPEFFLNRKVWELPGLVSSGVAEQVRRILSGEDLHIEEVLVPRNSIGEEVYQSMRGVPLRRGGAIVGGILIREDITARKRAEEALQKRLVALTRPLESLEGIAFEDLFNLADIQRLQDELAQATGVASIITRPDGIPITVPSNFCHLCVNIIRKTEKGLANCITSDATLGKLCHNSPVIQPCLSGGLWDAATTIFVGDCHVANWMLGQVRDAEQTEEQMRAYARKIGADEDAVVEAFHAVPTMSREQFEKVVQMVSTLANQLSTIAYQNVQQARFITERKKAEAALRESEERFLLAMKASNDGLFDWNLETNEIYYSPAWKYMLGYEDHELPNDFSIWENNTDPEDARKSWELQKQLVSKQIDRFVLEFKMRHKDGHWVDILSRAEAIFSDSGKAVRIVGTHTDITERKWAEEELRASEQQHRLLVQNLHAGVVVHSPDTKIILANEQACILLGLSLDQMMGKTAIDPTWRFVREDETVIPFEEYPVNQIIASRQPVYGLVIGVNRRAIGDRVWLLANAFPELDTKGQLRQAVVTFVDITERKQAEAEREKLQAQLLQAQKLEAVGTLAGGIAHDFNNILGAVVGYSEMVRDDLPPDSPSIHDINQVIKASHRAKDLVKQILAFSRQVEDQKICMQPSLVVKEAITLLRSSLPTTITIHQDIDSDAGIILADPTQIHQVIMNLATNAFHAMETKGGTLTISVKRKVLSQDELDTEPDLHPGNFVQLLVRDTGGGISPEIRDKIFDPFFTTKEVGKGTGLGLSMVYSIVKSCHGGVACNSRMGEGTEFCILLPAEEGYVVQETNGSTTSVLQGNEHILLIDDEEMLIEMGQSMLERLGYHVTTRRTSLDALTTFKNKPDAFDLIITDQTMPGMTGVDLARRILQIRPNMPIILCTGYNSQVTEEIAQTAGIKGFAYKPVTKKEIGELIQRVLGERNL